MNFFAKAVKLLFGGGSAIKTAANVVDEYVYTDQEKSEDAVRELDSARGYDPRMPMDSPIEQQGFILFFMEWILRLISKLVDAVNHAIRPWITIEFFGGVFGYWPIIQLEGIPPAVMSFVYVILMFWFGGRTIVKDVPAMIASIMKLRKG